MHPTRQFAWTDRQEMANFIRQVSFCTIFVPQPAVVHVPVLVTSNERLLFHVARNNRAAASLDGATALLSCLGPDAYVSPDWHQNRDQVPTWNYVAVEAEGVLRQLSTDELALQLDDLSEEQERRLAPKTPWTRAKMTPGVFEKLLRVIVGYEMIVQELRGTRKLSQNKPATDRNAVAAGVSAAGSPDLAALISQGIVDRQVRN